MRPFFVLGVVIGLAGCSASSAREPATRNAGRLMPPSAITCDRNQLTSWSGVVSGYRRSAASTWLKISTDDGTVEALTIEHSDQSDASTHYLLRGQPFTAQDWKRIEQSTGLLIDSMRAVAWVCSDGKTAAVIDWQPPGD